MTDLLDSLLTHLSYPDRTVTCIYCQRRCRLQLHFESLSVRIPYLPIRHRDLAQTSVSAWRTPVTPQTGILLRHWPYAHLTHHADICRSNFQGIAVTLELYECHQLHISHYATHALGLRICTACRQHIRISPRPLEPLSQVSTTKPTLIFAL
ncbi:hypothetical protein BDW68DRAFT_54443 [Aspergillus falconensis]